MLEFDDNASPRTPDQLVDVTRENGRNIDHYQHLLSQNALPKLERFADASILEVGTGRGNALPGLFELCQPRGCVVSIDINIATLREAEEVARQYFLQHNDLVSLGDGSVSLLSRPTTFAPRSITLIHGDLSDDLVLSPNTFDIAVSIWVFYQIADKLRAVENVVRSLRPGGRFFATSTGSISVTPDRLPPEQIAWLQERVWNTRASRFSWLTGTRELEYWARHRNIPMKIVSLPDALRALSPEIAIQAGTTEPGRPEGSFVITTTQMTEAYSLTYRLGRPSFVTTRNSSVIPLYEDRTLFEAVA